MASREVYTELGSPQTKEAKINAGTEAEPVIKRVAQKYNVSEEAIRYKLQARDLLGTPNEESSQVKDSEVKYYITSTGNVTYRTSNTPPPQNSKEITREQYQSYKSQVEETGRKQLIVDGIYYDIPKSANLTGETTNIRVVERQRLKGQPAKRIIGEARQEYSKIKQANIDVNYYELQRNKAVSGVSNETKSQTTPEKSPPSVSGYDVFNMGLEGKKTEYFNTQPGYISQINSKAQYFLFNNPITNSMTYRNILLTESKVEQARDLYLKKAEPERTKLQGQLKREGSHAELFLAESTFYAVDMFTHPLQTVRGTVDFMTLPLRPKTLVSTGVELAEEFKINPEKTVASITTPIAIFGAISKLSKGKESYIAERLKGEEKITTTYTVDGKPIDVTIKRLWIEESKPLSKKPEIQKSYNVKFIETRAGQINQDLKVSELKGYGKTTGGNTERVNYDIIKEDYLPNTKINPNVELKPGQTQTVKTTSSVKGYSRTKYKIKQETLREDIGVTESGIIIEGLKSKKRIKPLEYLKQQEELGNVEIKKGTYSRNSGLGGQYMKSAKPTRHPDLIDYARDGTKKQKKDTLKHEATHLNRQDINDIIYKKGGSDTKEGQVWEEEIDKLSKSKTGMGKVETMDYDFIEAKTELVKPYLRTKTKTITSKVVKGKNTIREKLNIAEEKPIQQVYTKSIPVKSIPKRIKGSPEEWKNADIKPDDFNYLKGKETTKPKIEDTPSPQVATIEETTATKTKEIKPIIGVRTQRSGIQQPIRMTIKESEIGGSQFSDLNNVYGPKQRTSYTLITPEEEYIRVSPLTEQSRGLSLRFAPALKQEIGQRSSIRERQDTTQTPTLRLTLEQSQSTEQQQITLQRQEIKQEQKQSLRERLIERARQKQKLKEPVVTLGKLKQPKEQPQANKYTLFVKSRGIFNRVFETESKEEAFRKGEVLTDITASASFKVTQDNEALPSPGFNPRYRESKKFKNIFVEKEKYRISTPGEKREITFLGIQSNKRRF